MEQQENGSINNASSGGGGGGGGGDQRSCSEHQPLIENVPTNSSAHKQELLLFSANVDVRMRRHPELQPYMPCDRFVPPTTTTPARPTTAKNSFGGSSNLAATAYGNNLGGNLRQPKKYVSMTRLNQLAQPKRRQLQQQQSATSTVPPSSLTSSNATSTTASSLASSKNFSSSSGSKSSTSRGAKSHAITTTTTTTITNSQQSQPKPPAQPRRSSSISLKANANKTAEPTTNKTRDSTASAKPSRLSAPGGKSKTAAAAPQQQKSTPAAGKTPQASRAPTSIRRVSKQSLKESTPLRLDQTFDGVNKPEVEAPISPIRTGTGAIPKVEAEEATTTSSQEDSISSQRISKQQQQQLENVAANQQQKQQMSVNNVDDGFTISGNNISNYFNDNSSNFASLRQPNDDGSISLAEQLSEMSTTDRHFQSAASDLLLPEMLQNQHETSEIQNSNYIANQSRSSTTNNGTVDLSDRNPDSLIRELQEDALAKGLALYDEDSNEASALLTPRVSLNTHNNRRPLNDDLLFQQHESTATMWKPQKAMSQQGENVEKSNSTSQAEQANGTTIEANNVLRQQDERMRREREEEEEERRLKLEEEFREKARREEREREERGKLVNSILSRVSQGSL